MSSVCLYWLHLPEHRDMFREGYIGVSKDPRKRLWEHKSKKQNPHLTNALGKYKDVINTILLNGDEDYCYRMELLLRPVADIGWNIAPGGSKPPSRLGKKNPWKANLGKKHPSYGKKRPDRAELNKKSNSLDWKLTDPHGVVFIVKNLAEFARKNNLDRRHLISVAQGKYGYHFHKGWSCEYIK